MAESIKGSLLMNFLNSLLIGLTAWRRRDGLDSQAREIGAEPEVQGWARGG